MTADSTYIDRAREALDDLPDTADSHEVLAAIHRKLTLDRDIKTAEQIAESRAAVQSRSSSAWWSDSLGCILPFILVPAFFIAMPLLFSVGERILSRPARTTARGTIVTGAIRLVRSTSPASRCFQIDKVADGRF
ncbi:hypothetical protein [Allorhodopirellula solitaria]|uniref:Uncharacterized protein n=1 Tax=Allorhodopirellula solitaria TaxID=2527987 RepID=A0A5C5WZL3_9BACT|nr:hypothetical protein [Allorhodopirellula solitaria]TWT56078.1 hypothetical protein CA85_45510 [Allorhodopirellula solitaria]